MYKINTCCFHKFTLHSSGEGIQVLSTHSTAINSLPNRSSGEGRRESGTLQHSASATSNQGKALTCRALLKNANEDTGTVPTSCNLENSWRKIIIFLTPFYRWWLPEKYVGTHSRCPACGARSSRPILQSQLRAYQIPEYVQIGFTKLHCSASTSYC